MTTFEIIEPGHTYRIAHKDGPESTIIQFVSRLPHHEPKSGILNQDLLRVIIDRLALLDAEEPWEGNAQILHHLRMAIALHEARAFLRHVAKGEIAIEKAQTGSDGHMIIEMQNPVDSPKASGYKLGIENGEKRCSPQTTH